MKLIPTLTVGLLGIGSASAASASDQAKSKLADCLKDVPIRWANSPDYGQLAKPFNLRLSYKPYVIVLPTTNEHVQTAVSCAVKSGVKVQAKSGGHSYASFSSGGKDGSMSRCRMETGIAGY